MKAPTSLIVGRDDDDVVELNRDAFELLESPKEIPKEMESVPNATHPFAEPGALERVAELSGARFTRQLGARALRGAHLHA